MEIPLNWKNLILSARIYSATAILARIDKYSVVAFQDNPP